MVDSNHRRRCQQIYSLSPLATREIPHICFGAGGRIRTPDLLITNQLLYQLSYTSISISGVYLNRCSCVCQHKSSVMHHISYPWMRGPRSRRLTAELADRYDACPARGVSLQCRFTAPRSNTAACRYSFCRTRWPPRGSGRCTPCSGYSPRPRRACPLAG